VLPDFTYRYYEQLAVTSRVTKMIPLTYVVPSASADEALAYF